MDDARLLPGPPLDAEGRRLQALLLRGFVTAAAGGVVLFLLLRVAAPWLIDLHDTPALWAGAACLLACPVVAVVTAFRLRALWLGRRAAGPPPA